MSALKAFDTEWKTGDREKAKEMAREYIEAHHAALKPTIEEAVREYRLAHIDDEATIPDLVNLVSKYRADGMENDRIIMDMWLLTQFGPQKITGIARKSLKAG